VKELYENRGKLSSIYHVQSGSKFPNAYTATKPHIPTVQNQNESENT
jgi:hypothetical protein